MSATAAKAQNYSAQAFISALVTNAVLLAVQVGVFVILKQKLPRIYSPRTFLPPQECVASSLVSINTLNSSPDLLAT
jgi:calcium permeable stress-gated cation channel